MDEGSPGLAWYGHQVSPQHGYRSCCLLVHFPDKKKGEGNRHKGGAPPAESSPFKQIPGSPTLIFAHISLASPSCRGVWEM